MRISFHGGKKSNGSTILLSLGMIFSFSLVMISLVAWLNTRYETVKKECEKFYGGQYIIQSNGDLSENN